MSFHDVCLKQNWSRAEYVHAKIGLANYIKSLTEDERVALLYDWAFWARPDQMLPVGNWRVWLLMAGRGFGKTRVIGEAIREWKNTNRYTSMIGATADDVNNTLIEGESGIMNICPNSERPHWIKSQRKLVWPNGAQTLLFSADAPERLRGKQHMKIAADEVAAWGVSGAGGASAATTRSDAEATKYAYDMAILGLRLGNKPQIAIATTPRPIPLLNKLKDHPKTKLTIGSTMTNKLNLNDDFIENVIEAYDGTRLGRQEVYGELLMDFPGALWPSETLEKAVEIGQVMPDKNGWDRIVVAIDPSGAADAKKSHDEIGIVVCGCKRIGPKERVFGVLDDRTMLGGPAEWAKAALQAASDWGADRIVAEINYGGAMVESTLRSIDPLVPYKSVTASRGKVQRAEPIAALYEQGKVGHARPFGKLHAQMEAFTLTGYQGDGSPDRVDALVWAITELMEGKMAPMVSGRAPANVNPVRSI